MKLYFKNLAPIELEIDNTLTGELYIRAQQEAAQKHTPHYTDNANWTHERLAELASIAKQELGWDWLQNQYTLENTAQLHKDLEHSVGTHGFDSVPASHDWLLYELHHCLHGIQHGKQHKRSCNLQVEWFTDDYYDLPDDFEFQDEQCVGDVLLINPYVGHNPLQIWMEQDYSELESTVKFHDRIKPGIVISSYYLPIDRQKILSAFEQNDTAFVQKHTAEKILRYSGAARIGRVTDVEHFKTVMNYEHTLEFEKIEF